MLQQFCSDWASTCSEFDNASRIAEIDAFEHLTRDPARTGNQ
jgi:hypothetical protein